MIHPEREISQDEANGEEATVDIDYSDLLADTVKLIISNQQGPVLDVIEYLLSTGPDDEALRTLN